MAAISFAKKNAVMCAALLAALVTCIFVPVDSEYLGYFDLKTLVCLFCVLAVVCALKDVNFFYILAEKIVERFKNLRLCVLALVYITFIGSMLIANDMALLTFLPLGYFVLSSTGKEKYMAYVFILQNISANLGGMLTPFGNPQNLYLYTKFNIPNLEFIKIMAPPFIAAITVITLCCLAVKPEKLTLKDNPPKLDAKRTAFYLILFCFSLAIVFRGIPYLLGAAVIFAALMLSDPHAIKSVDYPLLLTFVFFFIFAGNMARIPAIVDFMSGLLQKNTLIFSILSCQLISNVPSAILLSGFTGNYEDLLVGVNIGGVGTLIASLASLITFREYLKHNPHKAFRYILEFTAMNVGFLAFLTAFEVLIKTI